MNSDRTHNPINFYRTTPMEQIRNARERESQKKIACSILFMLVVCVSMSCLSPVSGLLMALFYLIGILGIVLPAVSDHFCRSM